MSENMAAESGTVIINMPLDVITKILQYLGVPDVINMMLTCKTMKEMILQDTLLWKRINNNRLMVLYNAEHRS